MENIIGKKFNKLTILEYRGKAKNRNKQYLTKCECGNETVKLLSNIKNGQTKSCGCYKKSWKYKHGMNTSNKFYATWSGIKKRCNGKSEKDRKHYYDKGVRYCPEWEDFMNFYNDMYESYVEHILEHGNKKTSIDRIDSNGNYCKENCRWATPKIQSENRSLK